MDKKSYQVNIPRVPVKNHGIQVNFCKNPVCDNYGVPANTKTGKGDYYSLTSGSKKTVAKLICKSCGEQFPIKSNQGIGEEINRIEQYLEEDEPCCPNDSCDHRHIGISEGKIAYQAFGKTKSGSSRYRCKSCGKSFSVKNATTGQKLPHKNKLIFKLLMNRSPFRRICEIADISEGSIYGKIDFIHKQCVAFVAERERKLLNGKKIKRLYVSVDRQEYVVNWSRRKDKRNIKLSAIGSADNESGYVFQMNVNYDPELDHYEIEQEASTDTQTKPAYRQHARLWLQSDYNASLLYSQTKQKNLNTVNESIISTYDEAVNRDDIEASEVLGSTRQLPAKGMQVHSEYTMYGHFFMLQKLFNGVEKVRFFLDQDSGIRDACLSAFKKEVKNRTCDSFYVRLNKNLSVDEKRRVLTSSRKAFKKAEYNHPGLSRNEVKLLLIKQRMNAMVEIGKWKDRWLSHPFPNMSEPEKAVCYLTDYKDYDEDHKVWLYNKASMHSIDCFFMQVRRRLSLLERPLSSASNVGRRWFGYSAYNPKVIIKMLDIFRVYYNYCLVGKNKHTPAMRLGLAKGVVPLEKIIYYNRNS